MNNARFPRISTGLSILFAAVVLVGCLIVDSMMFHPVKGGYDETLDGFVDIGTNGLSVAAVVRGPAKGKKAIMYCHGNAEDITGSLNILESFAENGYTVAAVDYPGYGLSGGKPDEDGCCRNVHLLYDWLIRERAFKPSEIIVVGFSIGTGPAVELASTREVGGLILEAPFLSAPRIVTKVRILPVDPFPNLDRIGKITCPLLVIHGTSDSIIPFAHGKELFDLAPEPKKFVAVDGADHNDFIYVMGFAGYRKTILEFIEKGADRRRF